MGRQELEDPVLGCEATTSPQSEQKVHEMWGHRLVTMASSMEFSKPVPKLGHYACVSDLWVTRRHAQSTFPARVSRAVCLRAPALAPPAPFPSRGLCRRSGI